MSHPSICMDKVFTQAPDEHHKTFYARHAFPQQLFMDFLISLKWTTHSDGALDVGGEGALKRSGNENWSKKLFSHFFSLLVPLLNPSCRADCFEVLQEELARLVLLSLTIAMISLITIIITINIQW